MKISFQRQNARVCRAIRIKDKENSSRGCESLGPRARSASHGGWPASPSFVTSMSVKRELLITALLRRIFASSPPPAASTEDRLSSAYSLESSSLCARERYVRPKKKMHRE